LGPRAKSTGKNDWDRPTTCGWAVGLSRRPDEQPLVQFAAAASAHATLVTGDAHLLELEGSIPVLSPRTFLDNRDAHQGL